MNIGLYQGASSLASLENWQEMVSQNIGASSVPGFKKSDMSFEAVLGGVRNTASEGSSGKDVGTSMPRQSVQIDPSQGELYTTGKELDFAIQGPGYFQVQKPDGQIAYTRNGQFRLNADRTIVTGQGYPVLGDGGPITLRPQGGTISINQEGMIVQGETQVGKLAVSEFSDPSKLQRIGSSLLAPKDASVQPKPIERPDVLSGSLEESNVSPLREMVTLVTISRAYEANQKLIMANDDNTEKAIQTLGNPTG